MPVVENIGCLAICDEVAIREHQAAITDIQGDIQIVGTENDGFIRVGQPLDQFAAIQWVHIGGRLIKHQNIGLIGEYGGQGQAFAFTEREVERRALVVARQADGIQCLGHPVFDFISGQAEVERAKGHIIENGRAKELIIGVLKDNSHLATNGIEVLFFDLHAGNFNRAFGGHCHTIEQTHKGRLTRTIGANQCHLLTLANGAACAA